MRIIFLGSGELACPSLDRLRSDQANQIVGVVTQPPRPKGRALKMSPCALGAHVAAWDIPVFTPEDVNAPESVAALGALSADLFVAVAYGQFLKGAILNLPPRGSVNLHASLLPKYRGAAPIQWAVANGETVTGVTTILLSERLDAGDIIGQVTEEIRPEDTAGSLEARLARAGAELLARTVAQLRQGTLAEPGQALQRRPQNEAEATRAPLIRKADGRIDWRWPALQIHNRVRGFNPWPGCFGELPSVGVVQVWKSRVEAGMSAAPGAVLAASGDGPLIQTGSDALRLLELQLAGRKVISGAAFLRGHPLSGSFPK